MEERVGGFDFVEGHGGPRAADPFAPFEALATALRPEGGAGSTLLAGSAVTGLMRDLQAAVQGASPDRLPMPVNGSGDAQRWLTAAREAAAAVFETCRLALDEQGAAADADLRAAAANAAAECIKWSLCDRRATEALAWALLGQALHVDAGVESLVAIESVPGAYIRAIAYRSAALDQLPLRTAVSVCRLIELVLPHLALERGSAPGPHYFVATAAAAEPARLTKASSADGWRFVPIAALPVLERVHATLRAGGVPSPLSGVDPLSLCDAVVRLLRLWSPTPPVRRFRRHASGGQLLAVCGFAEIRRLFEAKPSVDRREWQINDLSRGGVGAMVVGELGGAHPEQDELVAFRPVDGAHWHLGIVRRVRRVGSNAEVGIETLSPRPELVRVDDGMAAMELFFAGPVQRGEAVRVIAPLGGLRQGVALFVSADGKVLKLKPLDVSMSGREFELRVYQVL